MGWQIVLVDENNDLRNGGYTSLRTADLAEAEAYERADRHNEHNNTPRIINVVCVSDKTAD